MLKGKEVRGSSSFLRKSKMIDLSPLRLWSETGHRASVMYLVGSCNWMTMGEWCLPTEGFGSPRLGGLPERLAKEMICWNWEAGRLEGEGKLFTSLG